MSRDRNQEKTETDANDVIREYVESSGTDDEGNQTNMEWYEQAKQDTTVPPDAVLAGGDIDAAWDKAAVGEETVGGTTPTPDQDLVDEIGRAVGIEYEGAENYDKPAVSPKAAPRSKRTPSSTKRGKRNAA